jgi:hypothetical protein
VFRRSPVQESSAPLAVAPGLASVACAAPLDPEADGQARARFYGGILQHLDAAISATKAGTRYQLGGL